jgi:ABC-type branched-subunit amino acid transport system substrate-binding protein
LLTFTKVRAQETYRVALMVPLYLEQVDEAFYEAEPSNKTLLTKPFSFLHFYEGFMIAADSVVNSRNMQLDLKVYDVDNDVHKAQEAIEDPWLNTADMIVGPFYLKAFNVVKNFAAEKDIPIVNPITQRSEIVDYHHNVVKVKPSIEAQVGPLDSIVKRYYHSNNIFIVQKDKNLDVEIVDSITKMAYRNIDSVSYVSNKHIVDVIKKHQKRWKYLKVDFKETDYLTDNISLDVNILKRSISDSTAFKNHVVKINYDRDSLNIVPRYASSMRNNLFIIYGNDKVFANEIVNKVTKLIEYYPITVIMMPEWSKFESLFNDNLMKMHAIYFDDDNIDYQNIRVESFICKFRNRYETEPTDYAYQGFDIGWFFLNALRLYGGEMLNNLPYYDIPLLGTRFHFVKNDEESGYENTFWNVYQFKGYNKVVLETGYEK